MVRKPPLVKGNSELLVSIAKKVQKKQAATRTKIKTARRSVQLRTKTKQRK
jgi:hypothetical protein